VSARHVYRAPLEKRARLRAAAARYVAGHGLAGFNLRRLAAEAGIKFDLARWYYRTNEALIADVVRAYHAALGRLMAEAVLAARVEALASATLEAMAAERDGHRTARAAMAGLPRVAEAVRNLDAWLVGKFAEAVGDEVLGRSVLMVVGEWAARVEGVEEREVCALVVAGMGVRASGA
jgi:AcrR family transcriptional regulator